MINSKFAPIDLNSTAGFYEEYYSQQHGNGLSVFRGKRHMDGDGLGSMLGSVFRAVAPKLASFGRSAIKTVGRHAMNIARDAIAGEDVGESALRNLKAGGADLLDDITTESFRGTKRKASGGRRKRAKKQRGGTIFDD